MELNPDSVETMELLSQWFLHSLSPLPAPRRLAESSLSSASSRTGFALSILRLSAEPAADLQIRLAAAVHFKNLLRSRWSPSPSDPSSPPPIPSLEKDQIKALIIRLLLSSSPFPLIRSQLSESLSIISSHDFPQSWPSLLPELVSSLKSTVDAGDYPSINGLLSAANSIFLKFRHSFDTQSLRIDLKYCLDGFAAPLLETFLKTSKLISQSVSTAPPAAIVPLFESQRLCSEIFHSLNAIELPEFFEDHMREWMSEFRVYLTTAYPPQVEADGTVDALRSSICENLQLYMEKNEEEFRDYLKDFASDVWNLLMSSATSPSRDQLTITAIKFLTTVSTSVHHALFGSPQVLQQICQSIVFPNIRLREEDEELFEFNYVEYVRRDMEGSDIDTRRRIACELLKGLALNYREQVMALVVVQVQNMLAANAANPNENWKEKDAAIYLVVALVPKAGGGGAGNFVNVEHVFATAIVPELQGQDVNAAPMLKAAALKFFTVFREQIPKHVAVALLPDVIRFLSAEYEVVITYAANCIEKLLLVKDRAPMLQPRYGSADINPHLQALAPKLFKAWRNKEKNENQYIMKCLSRVLAVADVGGEMAGTCINELEKILEEECKNPKNPVFNHYLFDAIAALISRSCDRDPSLIHVFEAKLFKHLQDILVGDITEFLPYVFQILTLLVLKNRPPLSANYMELFNVLLLPDTWKRSATVPALAQLLQAYLQKVPNELNSEGKLNGVLGIFAMLVSASSTEELGFYVLNTIVENLSYEVMAPYMRGTWNTLFLRVHHKQTVKFVNSLVIFMSLVLVKYGHSVLVDSMNEVQPNVFGGIVRSFWIPNLKLISGAIEVKLTSVASTRLICESPHLLDVSAAELWGKMLDSIITLLARPDQYIEEVEADTQDVPETMGQSGSFARLQNVGKNEEDPLKEIRDPKEFLVTSLARLSAVSPGRFRAVIEQYVDPANQSVLIQLCSTYNCTII